MAFGMIHVYTGDGKGKTTAALGLALRASGGGFKVLFCQFMKGWECGEVAALAKIPEVTLIRQGGKGFVGGKQVTPAMVGEAVAHLRRAEETLATGKFDLVVLDEINVAVKLGLVPLGELVDFIERRPPEVELVLTGRGAHPDIVASADLVTEMRMVKHYYREQGLAARKGVEF